MSARNREDLIHRRRAADADVHLRGHREGVGPDGDDDLDRERARLATAAGGEQREEEECLYAHHVLVGEVHLDAIKASSVARTAPSTRRVLLRPVSPRTIWTFPRATPRAFAISARSASLAAPS